ncbi:MAG TPA: TIGR03087 family PEP-CTERM/XrtA system glycosyltransferase, partial [Arenibaculum sp.]|nr:TIGR03087 family PEP-CTERM/XrtA system glycosyltransferase [Arenibaculum sp.]
MSEILFLAHRIPYPPTKGDKVRSWNFLRHLTRRHHVHLGCFIDDRTDLQHVSLLEDLCGECRFELLSGGPANARTLKALFAGEPLSIAHFHSRTMADWVADLARRRPLDRVFVFSSAMAQYIPPGPPGPPGPGIVLDFVDVDSDKWRQYAGRQAWPLSWLYRREYRTLLAFDRRAAGKADTIMLVSQAEAELFRELAPESAARVHAVPNGVDNGYFAPDPDHPVPAGFEGEDIVFTGAMDYWANVDAVSWFARHVMPSIRNGNPDAGFWIVGSSPTPDVQRLASLPGVRVTGRVPDIRPWLHHAGVVVAPLRIARGTQNKVLEAMAMARPVVASSWACRGIVADPGEDLVVADTAEATAAAVLRLLRDRNGAAALGRRARRRVEEAHDWRQSFDLLDRAMHVTG